MAEKMTPNGLIVGLILDNQPEALVANTAVKEKVDAPSPPPEKNKGGRPKKVSE